MRLISKMPTLAAIAFKFAKGESHQQLSDQLQSPSSVMLLSGDTVCQSCSAAHADFCLELKH